jgi:molybdenum cofactor cytidylyltransferase
MRTELAGLHIQLVVNPRWQEGLSTSIDAALTMLEATAGVDAVLFTTCDQPRVTPDLLREMIAVYTSRRAAVVACAYSGTVGVPALFDRSLFPELRALRGDAGAKSVIQRHLASVATVPFPAGELDVDTGDDTDRLASEPREP